MDEALFAGDKKATDRLKSFITESVVTIEQKYQPRRTIRSFHRLFSSSNHAHFAQVDADDRRLVVLRVSDARKGDTAYWSAIHTNIADPAVISAMVHDLQNYHLDRFNVRERPKTKAHVDQKLRSLTGFDRYWHEVLQAGDFGSHVLPEPQGSWSAPCFVTTRGLLAGWNDYERGQRQFGARQERDVRSAMIRLCPMAQQGRRTVTGGRQARGYNLPPLSDARSEFAKAIGDDVDWED
jgi:hypothetical protein